LPTGTATTTELDGRRVVVYRGRSGDVHAIDARCPHLGSDLGRGRVVGDAIECPYHGFRYGRDGRCAQTHNLRTRVWPTAEHFGAVFVFAGTEEIDIRGDITGERIF
jgi:phenylpropionate dioxygenase-like ring-hydroxylating dioxygenase large terminal subunit